MALFSSHKFPHPSAMDTLLHADDAKYESTSTILVLRLKDDFKSNASDLQGILVSLSLFFVVRSCGIKNQAQNAGHMFVATKHQSTF